MVGYFVIQIELQKPEIIQPLPHNPHQLPLAADVVQKQQQHQLQDHDRVFRFMPFASVKARDSLSYESKVDRTLHGSERIVQSDPLFQIHAIVKQFRLALLDRPNHGPTFTPREGHRRSSWATGPAEEGSSLAVASSTPRSPLKSGQPRLHCASKAFLIKRGFESR